MVPVSVVIITKNVATIIGRCIDAARLITDDIVIVDNGSTDATVDIALSNGCRLIEHDWHGYGANKNIGNTHARYDWILSLDADEVIDYKLVTALHKLHLDNPNTVYDIPFRTYFGDKPIRYGSWGRDHHIRLFNRLKVKWDEPVVHEKLLLPQNAVIEKLDGYIHHYTTLNAGDYTEKNAGYAKLSVQKYQSGNKRSTVLKRYGAPLFHLVKCYLIFGGFMDGREGWQIAMITARNTWLKYHLLKQSESTRGKPNQTRKMAYLYPAKRAGIL